MLESLFVILSVISVLCAAAMYTGGRRGPATSNPWWVFLSVSTILMSLHVLGFLLPGLAVFKWAVIALALGASLLAALREVKFWQAGALPRPGNRELMVEVIFIVTSIYAASVIEPQLPDAGRVAIIVAIITPLLMVRWAATRLIINDRSARRRSR